MRQVDVRLGTGYQIYIGSGILSQLAHWLKQGEAIGKLAVITHPRLKMLYGDALQDNLIREGFIPTIILVPEGEEQKSLETAARLYRELSDFHAERATPVLAIGGGVIGDLVGFVAATYLRGVPLVQIPTTLLAQVDSSIGGKVAVDHDQLKNKIGAFYQPRLVVSDINTLSTLSTDKLRDGLSEVIKYSVIRDKDLFTYLEENLDRAISLDSSVLEEVVFRSAGIKAYIVERDERDLGLRNILNYGHTVGHAIETASDFTVRHGQAVAIGMVISGRISKRFGFFTGDAQVRLEQLLRRAGLPTELPNLNIDKVIQAMGHDKKILQGRVRFVLPKSIGEVFVSDEVSTNLIEQVLAGGNG
jgi:3-dehydroquinate synthase